MFEINDVGAARSLYEYALAQARVPRQFWSRLAQKLDFAPLSICLDPMTATQLRAKQKAGEINIELEHGSKGTCEISVWSQARSWTNLVSLLEHWNPNGASKGISIVIFSPNLKHAQMAAITIAHRMLGQTFLMGERPYRIEVVRAFEMQDRINSLPEIVVIPSIMPDLTASMCSMVSELLRGNHRVVAATNQTPQRFYDTYGVLPSHPYVIHGISEMTSTSEFISGLHAQT